jgi:leucyl-tRNA synthetase
MAEELWEHLGHADGVEAAGWPVFDPEVARAEHIVVPVQVNGKLRGRVTVPADITEDALREAALADAQVRTHIADKEIRKVVIAGGGKLVSVVVG